MIKLSICIPTYNYGEFIEATLESILLQIQDEVEVIVFDGGSTDNTPELVACMQIKYPKLIYHYQNFRGGIDRDIESVVSLARGKYCWLFSSDDILLPQAISKVFEAIKSNDDVYICEHVLCNLNMEPISGYPPFNKIKHSRRFNLGDISQKNEYFNLARTSEAFFSFLAGPIFRKEIWDSAKIPESFRSTCWIVAGHLLSMIPHGITVTYLGEALLHKREGNDSFSNGSVVNRYKIGIENFQHISNFIFGKHSEEAFQIRRVLHRDVPLRALVFAKLAATNFPEREDIELLRKLAKMHYSDATLQNRMKYAIFNMAHPSMVKWAYYLKKSVGNFIK